MQAGFPDGFLWRRPADGSQSACWWLINEAFVAVFISRLVEEPVGAIWQAFLLLPDLRIDIIVILPIAKIVSSQLCLYNRYL